METQWLVLLRGVNSGERENLPMGEVPGVLEARGLEDVKTCLQNGNIVLTSSLDAEELKVCIVQILKESFQLRAKFSLVKATRFLEVLRENPFEAESYSNPDNVHVFFLRKRPVRPNFQQMERFKAIDERWSLTDFAFYLTTPGEFRESKLGVRAERLLGVSTTRRTWNDVTEISKLLV
jgi:uncharacterized protein (DUF1697 family)